MPDDRPVLSVWEVNELARGVLQAEIGPVQVAGEVTDLACPASGHVYLTLKDSRAQLRAILWRSTAARLPFTLEDGMAVLCTGELDIYSPRGSYQLIVRQLVPQGEGSLQVAFRQLHKRLEAEGLFDAAGRRPLPPFPRWIAVLSSPTSAAIRDFLEVIRRRWADVRITVVPVRVQGEGAADEIRQALQRVQQWDPRPDVVVLTRGGGSLEDLWCFNDEHLVRAVRQSAIPVVSAVGHDIDVTLCDLAADVRALTPTEAAERVVPDRQEIAQMLESLAHRVRQGARRAVQLARQRLERLATSPSLRRPLEPIRDRQRYLDELQLRAARSIAARLDRAGHQLAAAAGRLESLSPLATLARGYTVSWDAESGELLRRVEGLARGQRITTQLVDGRLVSRIESVHPGQGPWPTADTPAAARPSPSEPPRPATGDRP